MDNNTLTLIFNGILAVCTISYSFMTIKLVRENRRLVRETRLSREFHLEAYMIAYLVNSETSPDIVSLIIKNIGNGVARNLRFKIIKDINYPTGFPLAKIGIFSKNLDFFPPNNMNKYILLSLAADYENTSKDYIEFDITYDDAIKSNKCQKFKLEFKDLEGFGKLNPPETYIGMISYRLEKIEKILEKK